MMKNLVYKIFLGFIYILRKMPRSFSRNFFKSISYLAYIYAKKTNRIIEANLNLVFDNKL